MRVEKPNEEEEPEPIEEPKVPEPQVQQTKKKRLEMFKTKQNKELLEQGIHNTQTKRKRSKRNKTKALHQPTGMGAPSM